MRSMVTRVHSVCSRVGLLAVTVLATILSASMLAVALVARVLLVVVLLVIGVQFAFDLFGHPPPAVDSRLYVLVAAAIALLGAVRILRRVGPARTFASASSIVCTRRPAADERWVRDALDRLARTADRPGVTLRVREDARPLCYTVSYPVSDPPRITLRADPPTYRSLMETDPWTDPPEGFDDPIPASFVVVVSTGLLDLLAESQVRALLAREVAHAERGTPTLTDILTVPFVWADSVIASANTVLEFVVFGIPAYVAFVAGAVARAAFRRGREYDADAAAVEATGEPAALTSALATLDESGPTDTERDEQYEPVVSPVPSGDAFLDRYLHPPLGKRIRRLQSMAD